MKIQFQKKFCVQSGLTLVEMMVATSLLVVMMLGLTAMFNQTQRAFRSGLKQVDVLEGGRAVMDLVARDFEQLAPSKTLNHWSLDAGLFPRTGTYDFFAQGKPSGTGTDLRTNVLHIAFLLNHSTDWSALGYQVLDPKNPDNFTGLTVGSLYRFSTNFSEFGTLQNDYFKLFYSSAPYTMSPSALIKNGYLTRVADGIVHFRLIFYDAAGNQITNSFDVNGEKITNSPPPRPVAIAISTNVYNLPDERISGFRGDALPAMVEVELGILEPQTLEQARSVADPAAYLKRQAAKVHIFRQQIPIRNAPR